MSDLAVKFRDNLGMVYLRDVVEADLSDEILKQQGMKPALILRYKKQRASLMAQLTGEG